MPKTMPPVARANLPLDEGAATNETVTVAQPVSDAALDALIEAFQPLDPQPITRSRAQRMAENLHGFFSVLERWAREDAAVGKGPWAGLDLASEPLLGGR